MLQHMHREYELYELYKVSKAFISCICEVEPVDRISIEAMDDVDQLAVASREGSRVRESQGGSQA